MSAAAIPALDTASLAPYPGLRPFEENENDIFFGREAHTDQLLSRLDKTRFLAVVGTSGSGKSSLVRAGLLPALDGGYLAAAGSHWRKAVFRPGSDPISSLAEALRHTFGSSAQGPVADMTETTLRRSSLGLVDAVRQAGLVAGENLLVVVDQFEEIFRYGATAGAAEAGGPAAFVALLLAAARSDLPVHVLLTMRSDFLGECARYRGLAEAVNDGIYLIPRMTRDQLRMAIEAPAASFGGKLSPLLVEELLNGVEDNPDQLPLLQHALMRTWNYWKSKGGEGVIGLEHYRAQGSVEKALSLHADEVYDSLAPTSRPICKRVFQCLTDRSPDGRDVRRPARLAEIAAFAGAEAPAVATVVAAYRNPEVSFLTGGTGGPNPVVDISHESLIRNWERLRDWVREDSGEREVLGRLTEAAALWRNGEGALWRDPDLSQALAWRERVHPSAGWARCTDEELGAAMQFLEASKEDRDQTAEKERLNRYGRRALVGVLAIAGLMGFGYLREMRRTRETFARRLAAESALEYSQNSQIAPAVLMGVESLRRMPVPAGDHILRLAMFRLPLDSQSINAGSDVLSAAWSPDSRLIAIGTDKGLSIYDRQTGQKQVLRDSSAIAMVAFEPSGDSVASAADDGSILVTPLRNRGSAVEFKLPDQATRIVFSPDGRRIAAACSDRKVYLIERESRKVRPLFGFEDTILALRFNSRGDRIAAAGNDGQVAMLSPDKDTPVWTWHRDGAKAETGSIYAVSGLAFYPDGSRLAAAAASSGVIVFDAATGKQIWNAPDPIGAVDVEVDASGKTVASAWSDFTVRLFDARTGNESVRIRHQANVFSMAFSPDGKLFASAGAGGAARVRSIGQNREVIRVPHSGDVNVASFSPNSAYLLTGSTDSTVRVMATASFEYAGTARAERNPVAAAETKASPDGQFLMKRRKLRADADWEYVAIESPAGKRLADFEQSVDGAFSPDGRFFVHGGQDEITVVRTGTWKETRQMRVKGRVSSIGISPDSRLIAVGTDQGLAQVFDAGSGEETARIPHVQIADNAVVDSVEFEDGDRYLRTRLKNRFEDREAFRHTLRHGDLIDEACRRVGRSMTTTEWADRLPDLPYRDTCPAR